MTALWAAIGRSAEVVPAGGARPAGAEWATPHDSDVAADKKYRDAQKSVREGEKGLRAELVPDERAGFERALAEIDARFRLDLAAGL